MNKYRGPDPVVVVCSVLSIIIGLTTIALHFWWI
jgi:hypothetical protein